MGAITLGAMPIQGQGMLLELKAFFLGDLFLTVFDFLVKEFFDTPTIQTDQMVVVAAFVEFKDGFTGLKV